MSTTTPLPERSSAPTLEALLQRADDLVPALEQRAEHCEALGRIPDETVQDLLDSGLFRILQPALYGGYEMDPMSHYRVVMRLAPACPSTAWVFSLLGIHQWEAGLMDPRIAADLWTADDQVRFSSSYAPFGKAERVPEGYRVSGRWPWSSGCDQCEWVILGAFAETDAGELNHMAFLLKRPDYTIVEDSWNYAGMAGTGSKDIVVDGAVVPAYRCHNIQQSIAMREAGAETFTAPTYRHPFGVVFAYTLTAVALGIADAALAAFIEKVGGRKDAFTGARFKEDPITQHVLAQVHALIDSGHLKMQRDFREMGEYIAGGEAIPIDRRVLYKHNAAWIANTALEAVNRIIQNYGGTGFDRSSPMQRYFRDINTMGNHLYINPRKAGVNLGLNLLTGDNQDPLL